MGSTEFLLLVVVFVTSMVTFHRVLGCLPLQFIKKHHLHCAIQAPGNYSGSPGPVDKRAYYRVYTISCERSYIPHQSWNRLGVVLETPEDNGTVFVDRLTLGYTILNESFYGLPRDGNGYPMPYSPPITAALPPFQRSRESSSWMLNWRASWEIVRPGIIPSPLMTPVIHSLVRDEGGIEYPCLSRNHLSPDWLGYEKYISLQPPTITDSRVLPSSLNIRDYPSNLIDAGLFAGLYGPHGIELLYITVRTLTAQDFYRPPVTEDGNPYTVLDEAPPEYRREGSFAYGGLTSRLGPFAQGWSPNGHISISTIKPGQRIIEAVKIHGDNNVPRGQRTFVGFLGDCDSDSGGIPLASADVREATGRFDDLISRHAGGKVSTAGANDEMCLLMEKYGLPVTSPRNPSLPWPTSKQRTSLRNPPMALSDTEMMASGEGWTIEGVGRIADMNFENPRWTDCLIHLESRRELLVWWLGSVVTYKRLECLSI